VDESAFLEVEKRKLPPSLLSMVYLEKEFYQTFSKDEFWYSALYEYSMLHP